MILLETEGNRVGTLIMFGLIFVVFYFFMIRPNQKKQKAAKAFRENLDKGDRIVTIGGIHGKVEAVKDTTVTITTEDGSKLKIEKSAIASEFTEEAIAQQTK
ncbi:MAG: preprotein translocase subunit YajC [Crocinitomicaceae bacterium]|nr:preprotein translocase subunit YajC [Crocinitomicaceae bacterium]